MSKRAASRIRDRRAAAHAFDEAVGARIRAKRQAAELSQAELGEKIGSSFSQVSRYEIGQTTCEPATLALLAQALDCKPSDFLDGIKVGK